MTTRAIGAGGGGHGYPLFFSPLPGRERNVPAERSGSISSDQTVRIGVRLNPAIVVLAAGLLSGAGHCGEAPTLVEVRRLLEFEQAVLAEDEGWNYLLDASKGEARHALLTRESRLPDAMLIALARNPARSPRMRAIGLCYLPVASLQRTWIEQILHVENADLQREVVFNLQRTSCLFSPENRFLQTLPPRIRARQFHRLRSDRSGSGRKSTLVN